MYRREEMTLQDMLCPIYLYISAKEAYIFAKEPYIFAKEPYIFAEEPYIRHGHNMARLAKRT